VNYQFTRALSLRGILDYNSILPNASLVALDRRKHLTADVLVTYLMHPGTAVYVGYTDGYDNFRRDETTGGLTLGGGPTTSTGRQVFVKASYLFRF
jgi:predicted porin